MAVHRRAGVFARSAAPSAELPAIPGLQRTTVLRHSAWKTRVNALLMLRGARETRREAAPALTRY
jgi:hypothetical protein